MERLKNVRFTRRQILKAGVGASASLLLSGTASAQEWDEVDYLAKRQENLELLKLRMDILPVSISIPSIGFDNVSIAPKEMTDPELVPSDGSLSTPIGHFEGLINTSIIFGHSRYGGEMKPFSKIINLRMGENGDEIVLNGLARDRVGGMISGLRYKVDGMFLSDKESGIEYFTSRKEGSVGNPWAPIVLLQTSVREDGEGKEWIFDREEVISRTVNLVKGSLDDPRKYLLLFAQGRLIEEDIIRMKREHLDS